MAKVFIYESDRHVYTWPEAGFDNDVIREQSRDFAEGKRGNPSTPTSTTLHHHKKDQACIGYHHEGFGFKIDADASERVTNEILAEMRTTVPTGHITDPTSGLTE